MTYQQDIHLAILDDDRYNTLMKRLSLIDSQSDNQAKTTTTCEGVVVVDNHATVVAEICQSSPTTTNTNLAHSREHKLTKTTSKPENIMKALSYFAGNSNRANNNLAGSKVRQNFTPAQNRQTTSKKKTALLPKWGWLLVGFVCLLSTLFTFFFATAQSFKRDAKAFQLQAELTASMAKEALGLLKGQNLAGAKAKMSEVKASYEQTKTAYGKLAAGAKLFGYGKYYADGLKGLDIGDEGLKLVDKVILMLEPYSEMLGLNKSEQQPDGTAEDRVKKILDALKVVGPEIDSLIIDLEEIAGDLNSIDASKYPDKVRGFFGASLVLPAMGKADLLDKPVKNKITDMQTKFAQGVLAFKEYRPLFDQLPSMMGATGQRRKYLILFQNNNELRPTGGFLTAYSIVYMENGKVTPEKSDDIYELDKKFTQKLPIPPELGRYLTTEKHWHLRDMNIDPDFRASMETFLKYYQTVKGESQDIDGIIAIDTKILTDLVEVLGPVKIEGYGEFSTEPDKKYGAPQIVIALSEIITRPTPYIREDRKGILGPMMKAILERTYGAGKEAIPRLFELMLQDLAGRHVQAYFLDAELQQAAEKINLAGRMLLPESSNADFLAIVDANLGGAKSNLFIDYSVKQVVLPPENGAITKQVTIDYKNSRPGDNCNLEAGLLCLNAVNNDWNRIYLPAGSKLVSAKGYKGEPQVYEDKVKGMTVIDGFFSLNPNSNAKIDLTYTIPYQDQEDYHLKIWQQGGLRPVTHLLDVNGNEEKIEVASDINYHAKFN